MLNSRNLIAAMAIPVLMAASSTGAEAAIITFSNTGAQAGGVFSVGSSVVIGVLDGGQTSGANFTPTGDGRISNVSSSTGISAAVTGACGTFGCLELTTGTYQGPDASTPTTNDYNYAGLNSVIRIYGTADGASGLLFSGSYDQFSQVKLTFDNLCGAGPTASASCLGNLSGVLSSGTINPTLAAFLGVEPNIISGSAVNLFFDYSGSINGTANTPPSGLATANTNSLQLITPAVIPEPGSMLLLGTGLLGLARAARRRMARA